MSSCSSSFVRSPAAIVAALAVCAALFGCATPLERAFGDSQRAHVAQSTAHPDAGVQGNPAGPRVDGMSTDAALTKDRTHESKVEEAKSETIINVGR